MWRLYVQLNYPSFGVTPFTTSCYVNFIIPIIIVTFSWSPYHHYHYYMSSYNSRYHVTSLSSLLLHQSLLPHYYMYIIFNVIYFKFTRNNLTRAHFATHFTPSRLEVCQINDSHLRRWNFCALSRNRFRILRVRGFFPCGAARCNKVGCSFIMTLHFHEVRSGQLLARIMNFL